MDDYIVANDAVVVNRHVGMNQAIFPDDSMMPDKTARHDKRPLSYRRAFANRCGLRFKGAEMPHQADESIEWVGVQKQGLAFGTFHLLINKHHRGRRVEGLGVVFRVVDEGDVARLHLVDFVQSGNREVGRANILSINEFR